MVWFPQKPVLAQPQPVEKSSKQSSSEELLEKEILSLVSADDIVGIYLKEMAKTPVLTKEEEIELAQTIERAKKAEKALGNGRSIREPRRLELIAMVESGKEARRHFSLANQRWVVSIVRKHCGYLSLDLIQEGNIGLLTAIEKFDWRRGFKFSTYATWWIRQTVSRAMIEKSRTIRIPVHMDAKIKQMNRSVAVFQQEHGRNPTLEELAEITKTSVSQVSLMLRASLRPLSLEEPINEGEETELGELIKDKETPDVLESVTTSQRAEIINELLSELKPREAKIIRLRFGLYDGRKWTLEEVAKKFGVTRERIRQLETVALAKLRHPRRKRRLSDYVKED